MALCFPYTAYASSPPLFPTSAGLLLTISTPIELPDVEPAILHPLFQWLYERKPPLFTQPSDLLLLMKIWVAASKLGIWRTQNTVLRLGMALMQPRHFVCSFETVRWVYENTLPGCALRGYVVAIFCQRGPPLSPGMFARENEKLGVFRDASVFLRELHVVRCGNPKGIEGYDLAKQFRTVVTWGSGRVLGCLVTEGKEVDWERIQYRLPEYLVWGENWEVLPDRWFVGAEGVERDGWEVVEQVRTKRGEVTVSAA